MPATAPDLVDIDHRSLAAIGSGDLMAYLQAASEDAPRSSIYIETVHRLTDLGAVTTHVTKATSREGFDAEWRITSFFIVDGDRVNRYEIFDEADLDAALAGFEELSRPAARLENAATQVYERLNSCFAARDWDAMTEILADDVSSDDRRRVVSAGLRTGRDAVIAEISGLAEIGVNGRRIRHHRDPRAAPRLSVVSDPSSRDQPSTRSTPRLFTSSRSMPTSGLSALVVFDLDDFDAAIAELDARYLAGEAAAHAHTWSVICGGYAAINRHELPSTTPDCGQHRPPPGDSVRARRPDRISPRRVGPCDQDVKALCRGRASADRTSERSSPMRRRGLRKRASTPSGAGSTIFTVEGDLVNRCEIFDEADLDAALARFEQLSRPAPRLENAASQVTERFAVHFAARDWDAMAELLADDFCSDDRRRVVGAGIRARSGRT